MLAAGDQALLLGVSDSDPEMLHYLTQLQVSIGDRVEMIEHQPFGGPCEMRIAGRKHALGTAAVARALSVR